MRVKPNGSEKWFTLVDWDFNDPAAAPVLFVDADGNTAEGIVEIDFDTWKDGSDA